MTQRVSRAGRQAEPERSSEMAEASDWLAAVGSNLALYAEMAKAGHPSAWAKFDGEVEDLKEALVAYEAAKREADQCNG